MFGWKWKQQIPAGIWWAPPSRGEEHFRGCVSLNDRSAPSLAVGNRPALAGNPQPSGVPSSAGRDPLLVILKPENGASVSLPVHGRGGYYFAQEGRRGPLSP